MHCLIKATQTSYLEKVKNNIGNTEVILPVNFAETSSAGFQHEIQSVYWTHPQINIFICFTRLKDITVQPYLVSKRLTSAMKHTVWAFFK